MSHDLSMTCQWLVNDLSMTYQKVVGTYLPRKKFQWLMNDLWMTDEWLVNDLQMTHIFHFVKNSKKWSLLNEWLANDL